MSIIYDALKKMEAQKKSHQNKQDSVQTPSDGPDSPKEKEALLDRIKANRTLKLLGIFFILLILFFFAYKDQIISLTSPMGRRAAVLKGKKIFGFVEEGARDIKPKPKVYEGYLLEGVIYDEQNPSAIINGRVLRKKDKIDDYTVTEISQDSVQLINREDNEVLTLYLPL